MNNRGIRFGGGFRMSTIKRPIFWDPSQAGMPTKPPRPDYRTTLLGPIMANHGALTNGMMTGTAFAKATGSFEVLDNTFPAPAELILGGHRLVNTVDYAVGALVADTAHNLAAAISNLPGFYATHLLAVVTVECDYQADDVEFRVVHYGGVISLGNFTGGGYLTKGVPYVGPPVQS